MTYCTTYSVFVLAGSDNDLLYNVDLNLEAKMKVSDKPIKCLLATR